jgi:hypothetical protein
MTNDSLRFFDESKKLSWLVAFSDSDRRGASSIASFPPVLNEGSPLIECPLKSVSAIDTRLIINAYNSLLATI